VDDKVQIIAKAVRQGHGKNAERAVKHLFLNPIFWLGKKPFSQDLLEAGKFTTEMLPSSASICRFCGIKGLEEIPCILESSLLRYQSCAA